MLTPKHACQKTIAGQSGSNATEFLVLQTRLPPLFWTLRHAMCMFAILVLRPPRPGRGVKTLPGSKSQKRVSGGVSGESLRVLADPPKTSQKRVSGVKEQVIFDSQSLQETRFWLVLGGSARTLRDSPRDSPGDSFLTFWAGEGFDSSARSGGSQP